jgi:predicted alpha/beta hydrolase family esterase
MSEKVLIVPGYQGSGDAHWQTWLERNLAGCERVSGIDWSKPSLPRWVEKIGRAIDASTDPVWVIAHSFGCLASAAAIAQQPTRIAGAILVAPADPQRFSSEGVRYPREETNAPSIANLLPQHALNINGLLVASQNDPWLALDDARIWARRWRLPLMNAGYVGHINVDSGFGPWPLLLSLLHALRFEYHRSGRLERRVAANEESNVLPFYSTRAPAHR